MHCRSLQLAKRVVALSETNYIATITVAAAYFLMPEMNAGWLNLCQVTIAISNFLSALNCC